MTTSSADPATVFIVDDHEVIREVLGAYLEMQEGLAVCGTAPSGEEALAVLPSTGCNLALVDVSMPGMNGIELVRHLRERHPSLLCLMLSGHAEQVYVESALRAGARGYVMKGDPEAIVTAVRRVLGGEMYLSEGIRGMVHRGPSGEA